MPASILPQNQDEKELFNAISSFYRFLNGTKTNWLKFTTLLSKAVADTIEPLTGSDLFFASLFCIKLQNVFVGCCTYIL